MLYKSKVRKSHKYDKRAKESKIINLARRIQFTADFFLSIFVDKRNWQINAVCLSYSFHSQNKLIK
jgi:putative IMPACT (imprinted ancient) family translation regulator